MRMRDLGNQPMPAQQAQQPRDVGGAPALLGRVLRLHREQPNLHVPVPEAVDTVLATQHRAEQLLLLGTEQMQAPAPAPAQTSWLLHPVEDLGAGLRPVHDRQGAEVALVGSSSWVK